MSLATKIYERLPSPARSAVASIKGYQLNSWRYGPDTDRLVGEALERDRWTDEQWGAWRNESLARLLRRAATRVPYYRDQWAERRRRGDAASPERLENWPILEKQALRENPQAFLADDCEVRQMMEVETSGTTGTPLRLWRTRDTDRSWYAIFEARLRVWNGVSRRDRWSNLGGQRVTPGSRRKPPYWVWNAGMRQLYLSSYHVTPDAVRFYLDALRSYGITHLVGYPSAMHAVAREAVAQKLEAPKLRIVISNAEPLFPFQRGPIAEAFGCRVQNTYGQGEIVCAGSECGEGTMHLWPDVGVTEVVRDETDAPVPAGKAGRLICTGLINADMPLIRYAVGDRGVVSAREAACFCGRTLPVLDSIEGRTADLILTPSGSPVGGLDTIFHAGLPMREAQIIQETLHRIRIRVVPAPGFGQEHCRDMTRGIHARLGPEVEVIVEEVDRIARTPAGKFRIQMSMLAEGRLP